MSTAPALVLAENSLEHSIGEIFHPIFELFAYLLAGTYSVVPNYALAIVILTIIVMAVLTPLTVKSTKSMIAMQEIQPEIKKLQQKYKGSENREQLNQEMMRLYKEKGINPAGGCLPMLLQMPFLYILYNTIKGLTNTVVQHGKTVAEPRYVPHGSQIYKDLVTHPGQMMSFGINLADKPFSHHASVWGYVPFFILVAVAVALQYFQMSQMTRRNPQAAQANKQMQTMQRVMPLLMAYIYFLVPAAVVIYMIISTIIRIATQDVIFRYGIVQPANVERALPGGGAKAKPKPAAVGGATTAAALVGDEGPARLFRRRPAELTGATPKDASTSGASGANGANGKANGKANGRARTNGSNGGGQSRAGATSGRSSGSAKGGSSSGGAGARQKRRNGSVGATAEVTPKPHSRSKSKRARKAR